MRNVVQWNSDLDELYQIESDTYKTLRKSLQEIQQYNSSFLPQTHESLSGYVQERNSQLNDHIGLFEESIEKVDFLLNTQKSSLYTIKQALFEENALLQFSTSVNVQKFSKALEHTTKEILHIFRTLKHFIILLESPSQSVSSVLTREEYQSDALWKLKEQELLSWLERLSSTSTQEFTVFACSVLTAKTYRDLLMSTLVKGMVYKSIIAQLDMGGTIVNPRTKLFQSLFFELKTCGCTSGDIPHPPRLISVLPALISDMEGALQFTAMEEKKNESLAILLETASLESTHQISLLSNFFFGRQFISSCKESGDGVPSTMERFNAIVDPSKMREEFWTLAKENKRLKEENKLLKANSETKDMLEHYVTMSNSVQQLQTDVTMAQKQKADLETRIVIFQQQRDSLNKTLKDVREKLSNFTKNLIPTIEKMEHLTSTLCRDNNVLKRDFFCFRDIITSNQEKEKKYVQTIKDSTEEIEKKGVELKVFEMKSSKEKEERDRMSNIIFQYAASHEYLKEDYNTQRKIAVTHQTELRGSLKLIEDAITEIQEKEKEIIELKKVIWNKNRYIDGLEKMKSSVLKNEKKIKLYSIDIIMPEEDSPAKDFNLGTILFDITTNTVVEKLKHFYNNNLG